MMLALITFSFSSAPAAAESVKILALGDSLSAGYGLMREDSFPNQLERALRKDGLDVRVVNGGVSGDTSAGGLSRLDWALSEGFDAVIVELGANDGLRALEPQQTYQNLDVILGQLSERGLAVLLTGMQAPPNLGPEYGEEFSAIYPQLAKKYNVELYPFFLEGVAAIPELNQEDTIHPNAKGVGIIVKSILPYVKKVLKKVEAKG